MADDTERLLKQILAELKEVNSNLDTLVTVSIT